MSTSAQIAKALKSMKSLNKNIKTLLEMKKKESKAKPVSKSKSASKTSQKTKSKSKFTSKEQLQKLGKAYNIPCAGLSILKICENIVNTEVDTGLRGPKPKNALLKKAINIINLKFPKEKKLVNYQQMKREDLSKALIRLAKKL